MAYSLDINLSDHDAHGDACYRHPSSAGFQSPPRSQAHRAPAAQHHLPSSCIFAGWGREPLQAWEQREMGDGFTRYGACWKLQQGEKENSQQHRATAWCQGQAPTVCGSPHPLLPCALCECSEKAPGSINPARRDTDCRPLSLGGRPSWGEAGSCTLYCSSQTSVPVGFLPAQRAKLETGIIQSLPPVHTACLIPDACEPLRTCRSQSAHLLPQRGALVLGFWTRSHHGSWKRRNHL